ncbi:MAG TPA: hypothetical protein PKH53_09360, partial [Candidatus Saccharicenans sp.]|nr:hypothetical protein [Candidatus Saccharicenans sp.]
MFVHRHHQSSAKGKSGKKPALTSYYLSVLFLAGLLTALFLPVAANERHSFSLKDNEQEYSNFTANEHTSSSRSSLKYKGQNSTGVSTNKNSSDTQELTG